MEDNHDVSGILAVPGAASTPAFMASAFPFIDEALDHRSLALDQMVTAIIAAQPRILVGVSIGAHLCIEAAQEIPTLQGLILVAPAWIDDPDPRHAAMATRIAQTGVREHLRALPRTPTWLHRTTMESWNDFDPDLLLDHLLAVSQRPGPGIPALTRILVPTVVIGFLDDPVHPWTVAQAWAQALSDCRLVGLPLDCLDRDDRVLATIAHANLTGTRGALLPDWDLHRWRRRRGR